MTTQSAPESVAPQQHHLGHGGPVLTNEIEVIGWRLTDVPGLAVVVAETADTGGNLAVEDLNGQTRRYSTIEVAARHRGFDPAPLLERLRQIAPTHPLVTAAARQAVYTALMAALDPNGVIGSSQDARDELWEALGDVADAGLLGTRHTAL